LNILATNMRIVSISPPFNSDFKAGKYTSSSTIQSKQI
jgi:hypothetical protein